jgi:Dyp-type peroxidase family
MAIRLDLPDIQGLFARGYSKHPHARFTVFTAPRPASIGALLDWLIPRVTAAAPFSGDVALQVAFTASGLRGLGLPDRVVAEFPAEFIEGMTNANRSRFLGDVGESDPCHWSWGGPGQPPVDGIVLLYATDEGVLAGWQQELRARLEDNGITAATELPTLERGDSEPFGFHDGISQPVIAGLPRAAGVSQAVAAGEFVLGYPNARGQLPASPLMPAGADPLRLLLPDPAGSGAVDLGRNGSYLVLRQLEQDVDGFWRFLDTATRRADGSEDPAARTALAAKMVGRWPSGAPLVKAPGQDAPALSDDNEITYRGDLPGLACPVGAHIRRANPRDSLPGGAAASLTTSGLHRLLRRARSYGPAAGTPSGTGLYFMCLAADLSRQFEFVQHTWLNNTTFNGLYDDADPLTGNRCSASAAFTVQARPVRHRHQGLPQFVRARGGAYFFLPGLSALRYLARLNKGAQT